MTYSLNNKNVRILVIICFGAGYMAGISYYYDTINDSLTSNVQSRAIM